MCGRRKVLLGTPSQALPRQLSRRESQAVKFVAEVLSAMIKFPAVLLPLPLGEVSPKVTERAHAVALSAKVLGAMRNLVATAEAVPLRADFPRSGEDVA